VRLTSPSHDAKRAGRNDPRGPAFGGSATDIDHAASRVALLQADIDRVNQLFTLLNNRELSGFQRLYGELQSSIASAA